MSALDKGSMLLRVCVNGVRKRSCACKLLQRWISSGRNQPLLYSYSVISVLSSLLSKGEERRGLGVAKSILSWLRILLVITTY